MLATSTNLIFFGWTQNAGCQPASLSICSSQHTPDDESERKVKWNYKAAIFLLSQPHETYNNWKLVWSMLEFAGGNVIGSQLSLPHWTSALIRISLFYSINCFVRSHSLFFHLGVCRYVTECLSVVVAFQRGHHAHSHRPKALKDKIYMPNTMRWHIVVQFHRYCCSHQSVEGMRWVCDVRVSFSLLCQYVLHQLTTTWDKSNRISCSSLD